MIKKTDKNNPVTKQDLNSVEKKLDSRMVKDDCCFTQTQKIKVNEVVYLPFKVVSLNYPISNIVPIDK